MFGRDPFDLSNRRRRKEPSLYDPVEVSKSVSRYRTTFLILPSSLTLLRMTIQLPSTLILR